MTTADCSDPVDIRTMGERDSRLICGCGRCPEPDPTPAELQRRVEDAAWRRATTIEELEPSA